MLNKWVQKIFSYIRSKGLVPTAQPEKRDYRERTGLRNGCIWLKVQFDYFRFCAVFLILKMTVLLV